MDLYFPPKPALILPAEKQLLRPNVLSPELLGLTMMARTTFLRKPRSSAPATPFGTLLDTGSKAAANITNPFTVDSSNGLDVAVSVGDLVVVLAAEDSNLTTTAVTDNLSNTYVAQNAGTDTGTSTGRLFYSRVTNAGTLNAVSLTATASADDVGAYVAVFAGPFLVSPVDANPANATGTTSPHAAPSSGTLSQAIELVVSWIIYGSNGIVGSLGGGGTLAVEGHFASSGKSGAIGFQVTAATTAIAHTFVTTGTAANPAVGTVSFKAA